MTDTLEISSYFPSLVYTIEKPEFLDAARPAALEHLSRAKDEHPIDDLYPLLMSGNMLDDARLEPLIRYIGQTAWNILHEQGYFMQDKHTTFHEFWCQEHHRYSGMEQHIHGNGAQIVGFYFIDTPEDSSRVVFYDPIPARVMSAFPESDVTLASPASRMVNYAPKPGLLMFTNAWLPHSFNRHGSDEPLRFIHFTLGAAAAAAECSHTAEII